jgi:hypothetical protein
MLMFMKFVRTRAGVANAQTIGSALMDIQAEIDDRSGYVPRHQSPDHALPHSHEGAHRDGQR